MALKPGSRPHALLFPAGDILINDVLIVLKQVAHTHTLPGTLAHTQAHSIRTQLEAN